MSARLEDHLILADWMGANGLSSEDLDDTIHDLYSDTASHINNGGIEAQAKAIIESLGDLNKAKEYIREINSVTKED